MKTYTIHLLRHGMTKGNKIGQYVGSTDVDLSTDGIKELQALRNKYDYTKPDLIFSSPMKRCIQTIDTIYGNCDVYTVEDLRECNMGDFEGKTADELVDNPEYMDWVQHGSAPPNGENNKDFATRVCSAFVEVIREILKSGKTNAVICAHGGVIMTFLAVFGLPQKNMIEYMTNNGRGYTIRVTPSVWMRSGMVEVVGAYPKGSDDEPDNSKNPVKNTADGFELDEEDLAKFQDEDECDIYWADIEEKKEQDAEENE